MLYSDSPLLVGTPLPSESTSCYFPASTPVQLCEPLLMTLPPASNMFFSHSPTLPSLSALTSPPNLPPASSHPPPLLYEPLTPASDCTSCFQHVLFPLSLPCRHSPSLRIYLLFLPSFLHSPLTLLPLFWTLPPASSHPPPLLSEPLTPASDCTSCFQHVLFPLSLPCPHSPSLRIYLLFLPSFLHFPLTLLPLFWTLPPASSQRPPPPYDSLTRSSTATRSPSPSAAHFKK